MEFINKRTIRQLTIKSARDASLLVLRSLLALAAGLLLLFGGAECSVVDLLLLVLVLVLGGSICHLEIFSVVFCLALSEGGGDEVGETITALQSSTSLLLERLLDISGTGLGDGVDDTHHLAVVAEDIVLRKE